MSDGDVNDVGTPSAKRHIKLTSKGLGFYTEMCQQKRSTKCKQAKGYLENIHALMASNENVNSVNIELSKFIKCYQDANDMHESFVSLPLPQDEVVRQNKNHKEKMTMFYDFTGKVKSWLSEMGQPYSGLYVQPNEDVADDINPEDSASNVSSVKKNSVRTHSQISRTSSTSYAHIEAKADRAALIDRVAALKKKHSIEDQEEQLEERLRKEKEQLEEQLRKEKERLRKEKEQLELETELAATNAKLHVLENMSSRGGSKCSDGMDSYFEKNNCQKSSKLNPHAYTFVPDEMDKKDHVFPVSDPITQPPVVRPKQRPVTQTVNQKQAGRVQLQTQTLTENYQNDIINVMQRQNDIAALLVQQNLCSVLPARNIPVFDGDPLQYRSFIRALKMEWK